MPTASLALPFAGSTEEREKAFTSSMEIAAIFLLAEARRRKRGAFRTIPGTMSFVSKLHYPLWAVPWSNQSLVVDGLRMSSSVIVKQQLPNVTAFIEDVERGASVRELFRGAIEKHMATFSDFAEKVNVQLDAVIADHALLSTVSDHVREALSAKSDENSPIALVTPELDVKTATEVAKQAQDLLKQVQSERASLEYARNLLIETTYLHEQMILKEAAFTRDAYDAQIAEIRPVVEKKTDQLLSERDTRIAKMNRIAENELRAKEREKERRERELQKLELGIADFVKKREARRRKHDKIGEAHWEHRIRTNENKIDEVKAKIRALVEFVEKTRKQNESDAEKAKQGYQWVIDNERRRLTDLEYQRDDAVGAKQRETETLKLATNRIAEQIEELAARKKEEAEELTRLGIPSQFDDATLLCLPLYLIGFRTENETQFHVFPPVKVMSPEGVVAAIRKKLGGLRAASKVKLFLQPRSKALSKMLDFALKERLKSDKAFSENLSETAISNDVMLKDNFKELLTRGVSELKVEGWITQKEEALIKAYL